MNGRDPRKGWRHSFLSFFENHQLLCLTLFAFVLIWFSQYREALDVWRTGFIGDTDDATRLTQVRDLLAGQNWFDLHQYRIDPPDGLLMHWSRLIDTPVALLISFFKLFTDTIHAERLARLAWPAFLELCFFASLLLLARVLAGRAAMFTTAVLAGFQWLVLSQFRPGRIDHHSVQLTLSVLLVFSTLRAMERPLYGWLAGLFAAVMMAVGFEILPIIGIVGLFYAALWIYDGRHARALCNFAVSYGLCSLALFLATAPPSLYFVTFCDAQSFASAVLALCVGIVGILLMFAAPLIQTLPRRLAAGAIAGGAIIAAVALSAKQCISGPFAAVPPDVKAIWLSGVQEAIGLLEHLRQDFWNILPYAGLLSISIGCALAVIILQRGHRMRWGLLLALVFAYALFSFNAIRANTFAVTFAIPSCAWCITQLRERAPWAMALLYILCIPAAWAVLPIAFATPSPPLSDCYRPSSFSDIAKLPPGRALAPIDLGAFLLAFTNHSVYGAPYHRNIDGIRFSHYTLADPPAKALAAMRERHVRYVFLCAEAPDTKFIKIHTSDGLIAKLIQKDEIPGLRPLPLSGPIMAWEVNAAH